MRQSLVAVLIAMALGCSSSLPPPPSNDRNAPGSTALDALGDTWIGGFGPVDKVGAFVRVDFSLGTIRLDPRDDLAPLGIVRAWRERDPSGKDLLHFTAYEGSHCWTFALRRNADDALEGTVSDPKAGSANIRLVHAAAFTESMSILEGMKKRDFTLKLAEGAGHELFLVTHDTEHERQLSPGISPVAIETLHSWLREHARGAPSK